MEEKKGNIIMEKEEKPMNQKGEKKEMRMSIKILIWTLITILILFIIWCLIVITWPGFSGSYATIAYAGETSSIIMENYRDEEILSHFSLSNKKSRHLAWNGPFSCSSEYHYEHLLTTRDDYFLIQSLTIVASYGEGSFEMVFSPEKENLVQVYHDVVLSEDIDLSSISYSVKSGSVLTGYNLR